MREFQVFYKGLYIGRLVINEAGEYLYYLLEHAKTNRFLTYLKAAPQLLEEQTVFGAVIPFFKKCLNSNNKHDDVRLKDIT